MAIQDLNIETIQPSVPLREVSIQCNDEEFKRGLTKGYYRQQIRNALDKLSFSTRFKTRVKDLPTTQVINGQIELPNDIVDLCEVYLINKGNCGTAPDGSIIPDNVLEQEEIVDGDHVGSTTGVVTPLNLGAPGVSAVARVYFKRRYNNQPFGAGYTAHETEYSALWEDWAGGNLSWMYSFELSQTFFANIQNGMLMLSPNYNNFSHVRFIYAGTEGSFDDVPCLPRYLYEFVRDFMTREISKTLAVRFPREGYERLFQIADNDLNNLNTGSYQRARRALNQMSEWQRNDFDTFLKSW